MLSTRFNRWTIAAVTVAALAAPGSLLAQTPEHTGDNSAQFPSKSDLKSLTTSGSYLAARHASVERDANSAAAFYRSALRTDPKNNELLDRAFISSLADGDIDEAVKLADRILTLPINPAFASLNLAQAVVIVAYEWFKLAGDGTLPFAMPQKSAPAVKEQLLAFFSSLEWEVLSRNRFRDTIQAQAVVIDWCYTFYNHQRRHSAADGLSPVNYEIRESQTEPEAA